MSTSVSNTTGQGAVESLDDRDKLSGRIDFKVDKFKKFARAWLALEKLHEEKLCIRGLNWRIGINKSVKNMREFLATRVYCHKEGKGWSCRAIVSICLHSQNGGQDLVQKFECNFHPGIYCWGFNFLELEQILDPANGWLDEEGALHVSAEIQADEPLGVSPILRSDVLSVNGKEVNVNKHHLASKSDYFKRLFFGEDCKKNTEIELDLPATVDHFERMLDAMEPQNRPLDDQCIEPVLHLANQFQLLEVEGKCFVFLAIACKRSAIFKYRLADQHGFPILRYLPKANFFKEADFVENLEEFAKLDGKAREALATHLGGSRLWTGLKRLCKLLARTNSSVSSSSATGPDVLLVNDEEVKVDKHHLAVYSDYFERFFFGEGYRQNNQLEIELPGTVGHFKRMLDTMEPQNRQLDDRCVEGVYHLANHFLLREVEEKCRNFLTLESKRSAIFKYRLVDKYGSDQLKNQFLDSSKADFFKETNFVKNLEEFAKLDGKAREALATRLRQLFASP